MPRHQKVAGYYVIPSEILSVRPSVRPSVCPSVRLSVSAHHHSCIGNSSYSFRPILLKFTGVLRMVWRYAYCFFRILKLFFITFSHFYAPPPESGGVLCYTLRNFECPSVRPSVSAHHLSCIGNSSYSLRPILLKLYRCFKDGLKICILFFSESWNYFLSLFPIFMPRHQKVAGYYVIPSEILSVRPSVRLSAPTTILVSATPPTV